MSRKLQRELLGSCVCVNMVLWYCEIMKTTIDIPDALYRQVKIKAFQQGTSLRAMMLNSLRREIDGGSDLSVTPSLSRKEQAIYTTNELGFVLLKRNKTKHVINDSFVNDLREREGI